MQTGTRRSPLSFQGLAGSPRQALETDGVNGSSLLSSTNFIRPANGRRQPRMTASYTKPTRPRKAYVRRFPKVWARTEITPEGVLIGVMQRRGFIGLFDAQTSAGGSIGAFTCPSTAILEIEMHAIKKLKHPEEAPPDRSLVPGDWR